MLRTLLRLANAHTLHNCVRRATLNWCSLFTLSVTLPVLRSLLCELLRVLQVGLFGKKTKVVRNGTGRRQQRARIAKGRMGGQGMQVLWENCERMPSSTCCGGTGPSPVAVGAWVEG